MKRFMLIFTCLIIPALLAACAPAALPISLGVLSAVNSESLAPGLLTVGVEQQQGYALFEKSLTPPTRLDFHAESARQDELQVLVRSMVEDKSQAMLGVVGATSNESTLRAAALSNFFNIPMLVPSAVGDNVLPENNLWAFRLSAPGSAHAAHLFGTLLTRQVINDLLNAQAFPQPLRLGIVYEQNTFGEGTAVATARAAMAQDVEIGLYASFNPDAPDETSLDALVASAKDQQVHLVYLVSSNPQVARRIVSKFKNGFSAEELPVLLGQSGAFASREFLSAPEAEGMFILRQQIVPDVCPSEIDTLSEAQSYAAVYLLNFAVDQVRDQYPRIDANNLRQAREAVRDRLKGLSLNTPCLGLVIFDNAGQNKNPQFELLQVSSGLPRLVSAQTLQTAISVRLNFDPFE